MKKGASKVKQTTRQSNTAHSRYIVTFSIKKMSCLSFSGLSWDLMMCFYIREVSSVGGVPLLKIPL